jgi:glutamyl-tRNA synthetase
MEQFRDEGYLADAMVNYLMTLGWSPPGDVEIVPWNTIEQSFRLEDVNHSPAFFDLKKLAAFNGEYIRMMSSDEFMAACLPLLQSPDVAWPAERFNASRFAAIAPLVQLRLVTMNDVPGVVDFLFLEQPVIDAEAWAKTFAVPSAGAVLAETTAEYAQLSAWDGESLKGVLEAVGARHELKLGKAQASVRLAITGRLVGPPLFEALEVLGRDEVLRRLHAAIAIGAVPPAAVGADPA